MKFSAVLFDHDGTLVDSEATHMQLWREVMLPFGVTFTDDEYWQRMLGVPMEDSAADLIERFALNTTVEAIATAKTAANDRYLANNHFPQMPQATRILKGLSASTRLALVSGAQRMCVDASIRGHGWEALFDYVVSGDDVARNKPHPDSYLSALAKLNIDAEDGVAVEDTEVGVSAARAAGLKVVAIRSPHSTSHDFSGATVIVDSLIDAHAWLAERV